MPLISSFYGILIKMYFGDHVPPHFHAEYGEFAAQISINDFGVQVSDTTMFNSSTKAKYKI
jgi:hypothetical protein